eukprot:25829-Chlamydomonas_euryale.AAC.1
MSGNRGALVGVSGCLKACMGVGGRKRARTGIGGRGWAQVGGSRREQAWVGDRVSAGGLGRRLRWHRQRRHGQRAMAALASPPAPPFPVQQHAVLGWTAAKQPPKDSPPNRPEDSVAEQRGRGRETPPHPPPAPTYMEP